MFNVRRRKRHCIKSHRMPGLTRCHATLTWVMPSVFFSITPLPLPSPLATRHPVLFLRVSAMHNTSRRRDLYRLISPIFEPLSLIMKLGWAYFFIGLDYHVGLGQSKSSPYIKESI